eukprot:261807_1
MKSITLKAEMSIINILYKDNIDTLIYKDNMKLRLPTVEYEWKIIDINIINKIQNAANGCGFISPIFEIYGLKFYVSFWPNGSRESRIGQVNAFINIMTFKCITMEVIARINMIWVESNDKFQTNFDNFCVDEMADGALWKLGTNELKNFNSFTFRVEISLLDIIIDNKVVTNEYVTINNTKAKLVDKMHVISRFFEWKINGYLLKEMQSTETYGIIFRSDKLFMFGMIWQLMCFPNGRDDENNKCIDLGIDVELMNDSLLIIVRFTFEILEIGIKYIASAVFHKTKTEIFWGADRISIERFRNLKQFTIVLCLELIDVFDNKQKITHMFNGRKCDNLFINNMNIMNEIYEKIRQMNGIKEEKKSNEHEDNILVGGMSVELWLANEMEMSEYYEMFVTAGIQDLDIVKMLTRNELELIGISNVFHQTIILIEIAKLMFT